MDLFNFYFSDLNLAHDKILFDVLIENDFVVDLNFLLKKMEIQDEAILLKIVRKTEGFEVFLTILLIFLFFIIRLLKRA